MMTTAKTTTATTTTMLAAVKAQPKLGGTELKSVPIPEPAPDEVLIKVKVASICGTDVHIYDWNAWAASRIKLPLIYGHEFAGEIVKVGDQVRNQLQEGDYVSAECHIACGSCYQCKIGYAHICRNVSIFGVDRDGIFAEYVALPATNVWRNDPELPLELTTIQDPLGNAIHTVFSVDIPGRTVAVVGCGPIGLMAIALCKMLGAAKIFAVGRKNEYRLKLARELGADKVIKSAEEDPVELILEATGGVGVETVLEMSGSAVALNQALKYIQPGGEIAILGLYAQDVPIDVSNDIVFKYIRIYGINGRLMYDTWYRMAGILKSGRLNLNPIITHKFKFDQFETAMNTMRSGNSGKVVIYLE